MESSHSTDGKTEVQSNLWLAQGPRFMEQQGRDLNLPSGPRLSSSHLEISGLTLFPFCATLWASTRALPIPGRLRGLLSHAPCDCPPSSSSLATRTRSLSASLPFLPLRLCPCCAQGLDNPSALHLATYASFFKTQPPLGLPVTQSSPRTPLWDSPALLMS